MSTTKNLLDMIPEPYREGFIKEALKTAPIADIKAALKEREQETTDQEADDDIKKWAGRGKVKQQ
jgi:hypothetical protein